MVWSRWHTRRRRRRRLALVLIPLLLAAAAGWRPLGAQNPSRKAFGDAPLTARTIGNELWVGVSDVLFVFSSPFRAEWRDLEAFGAVAATTVAVGAFDKQIDRALTDHPSSVVRQALEPFGEKSDLPFYDLATGRRINPISGALYLTGLVLRQPVLREVGMGCLSSYWANSTARHLVYEYIARPRPILEPENPYFIKFEANTPVEWHSFFGGHAANAMTCFTFVNHRYSLGYVEPVLYGLGATLSVVRMADRKHWGSDTVLGMAFGFAVGKAVAGRYEKRDAAARARANGDGGNGGAGDDTALDDGGGARSPRLVLLVVDGLRAGSRGGVSYVGWQRTF